MIAKQLRFILICASPFLAVGVIGFFLVPHWQEHQLMRQSEPIQASLENYRQQHGHFPDSLVQIGIEERLEGPIYYERDSESSYHLWFGTTLGESMTFNSVDRRWR